VIFLKTYYVINGEYLELGISELKALIETYDPSSEIVECHTRLCIVEHNDLNVLYKIMNRASLIDEAGLLIGRDNLYEPSYSYIDEIDPGKYSWLKITNPYSIHRLEKINEYARRIHELTNISIRYKPGNPLHLFFSEGEVIVGETLIQLDKKQFHSRSPDKKPFFRSIALKPRVARLLVNLARVREGEILLDPFCGTGSILVEAGLMGIKGIGVEIDRELVKGASTNIRYYNIKDVVLINADSRFMVYNSVDGIATDPPYGRSASTHGSRIEEIYFKFLVNAQESVKNKGYIVFMSPQYMESKIDDYVCNTGLIIVGKHYMYIHGSLTRIIYEVVKI